MANAGPNTNGSQCVRKLQSHQYMEQAVLVTSMVSHDCIYFPVFYTMLIEASWAGFSSQPSIRLG